MNSVTYTIALTSENAGKIDAINQIIIGGEVATGRSSSAQTEGLGATVSDVKKAAKAAKAEHGEDFVKSALISVGAEVPGTLIKAINAMDIHKYADLITSLEAGPKEDDGFGDDDGFGGDDEAEADIDPEAVKTALKAYAKEKGRDVAKKLMTDNGAKVLSDVAKLPASSLKAILLAAV